MSMQPEGTNFVLGKIEVVENNHDGGPSSVDFKFNPAKLVVNAASRWEQPSQSGNRRASAPTYKGPEARTMAIELLLDGWDPKRPNQASDLKVNAIIETLVSWTRPTESSRRQNRPKPPIVTLKWGPDWFPCYVASANSTITMFDTKGFPLRATVAVSLKEMPADDAPQNPTSGSRVGHQSHILIDGETLPGVAHRYYEKPAYWRGVAIANGIDDPTRIRPGTRLYLPPIEDVAAASK